MKRINNLFEEITSIDTINKAHKQAQKGKSFYKEVKEINNNPSIYLEYLQESLKNFTFTTSPYERFIKKDSGKERVIYKLPYYPDRIVHHALMLVLEPIWKKTLITNTYQSIKGRGLHKCLRKVKKAVQQDGNSYYLQLDINKFYPSIRNEVVINTIHKKIKCKNTLQLLEDIVQSHSELPIGNYLSQYLGNLTLSTIDHKMKEIYKCKYYYRYCDDIIIIENDKKLLHKYRDIIQQELSNLGLSLKSNYQINKINHRQGVNFLGYVVYKDKVLIRKGISKKFKRGISRAIKNKDITFVKSLSSYYGWFRYANCYNLWNKYITMYYNSLLPIYRNHKDFDIIYKMYTRFDRKF